MDENRLWRAVNRKTGTDAEDVVRELTAALHRAEQRLRDNRHVLNTQGISLLERAIRGYREDLADVAREGVTTI